MFKRLTAVRRNIAVDFIELAILGGDGPGIERDRLGKTETGMIFEIFCGFGYTVAGEIIW
jgi:hypothetical protein